MSIMIQSSVDDYKDIVTSFGVQYSDNGIGWLNLTDGSSNDRLVNPFFIIQILHVVKRNEHINSKLILI